MRILDASDDRDEFARDLIVPLIENEISKRGPITTPTNEEMNTSIEEVLEEISDDESFPTERI